MSRRVWMPDLLTAAGLASAGRGKYHQTLEDSTGKLMRIGDTVRFRGQHYTIKSFEPWIPDGPGEGPWVVKFIENQHNNEIATEFNVDLVARKGATNG